MSKNKNGSWFSKTQAKEVNFRSYTENKEDDGYDGDYEDNDAYFLSKRNSESLTTSPFLRGKNVNDADAANILLSLKNKSNQVQTSTSEARRSSARLEDSDLEELNSEGEHYQNKRSRLKNSKYEDNRLDSKKNPQSEEGQRFYYLNPEELKCKLDELQSQLEGAQTPRNNDLDEQGKGGFKTFNANPLSNIYNSQIQQNSGLGNRDISSDGAALIDEKNKPNHDNHSNNLTDNSNKNPLLAIYNSQFQEASSQFGNKESNSANKPITSIKNPKSLKTLDKLGANSKPSRQ